MRYTRWLSRKQAARYCTLSISDFDRKVRGTGEVPEIKLGRKPIWDSQDLDLFLVRRKGLTAEEFMS